MLSYIIIFFLLSVIAAILGFTNLAGTFSQISKILAIIFLGLLILSVITHLL